MLKTILTNSPALLTWPFSLADFALQGAKEQPTLIVSLSQIRATPVW